MQILFITFFFLFFSFRLNSFVIVVGSLFICCPILCPFSISEYNKEKFKRFFSASLLLLSLCVYSKRIKTIWLNFRFWPIVYFLPLRWIAPQKLRSIFWCSAFFFFSLFFLHFFFTCFVVNEFISVYCCFLVGFCLGKHVISLPPPAKLSNQNEFMVVC